MNFSEKYKIEMDNIEFNAGFLNDPSVLFSQAAKKNKELNFMHNSKTVKILAVVIALIVFSVTAGAVVKLVFPHELSENLGFELDNIRPVVDSANCDKNSVKTVCKTYSDDNFTVTFEAIANGKALDKFCYIDGEKMHTVDGGTYAVFTIRRNDNGKVLYAEDGKGLELHDFGYIVLIKGYYTNPSMLADCAHYNIGTCEVDNVLYVACDITNAEMFADEDLFIAITNDMVINYETIGMTRDGEFYYTEDYNGIKALFDFDLDDSLADHEKAEAYKADHPFFGYDEFQAELAKSLAELEEDGECEDYYICESDSEFIVTAEPSTSEAR